MFCVAKSGLLASAAHFKSEIQTALKGNKQKDAKAELKTKKQPTKKRRKAVIASSSSEDEGNLSGSKSTKVTSKEIAVVTVQDTKNGKEESQSNGGENVECNNTDIENNIEQENLEGKEIQPKQTLNMFFGKTH